MCGHSLLNSSHFLLFLRALAAGCRCSPGAVRPCREGWSGQTGCLQRSPDLLSTSHFAQFTWGCPRSKSTWSPPQSMHCGCVCFHFQTFLFRIACCCTVCFLWCLLCARRSWIVTTLPSKVSCCLSCLFMLCNTSVAYINLRCCCSVKLMAEEGERMSGWSVEGDTCSPSSWQLHSAAAAHSPHLDQCRKPSENRTIIIKWSGTFLIFKLFDRQNWQYGKNYRGQE